MPYVPINIVTDRPLSSGASLNIPYPEGRNEGYFFSGVNHTMTVGGSFFRCPRDFLIVTAPDRITLTWQGNATIPARSVLNIQLETPGSDFYFDAKNGVTVNNMVHSPMFMLNLGAPQAAQEDAIAHRQQSAADRPLQLANEKTDCPRNLIVYAAAPSAECHFLVEGLDVYGRTLRENIIGASQGRKAFATIRKITPSHACGEACVGTGAMLGLPVFLPAPGFLMREIINGESVSGGLLVSGDKNAPTPSSGDCRGLYSPPNGIALDGRHTVHLLVSLPNPGNIGLADFT
jgi:hypothetical protein